MAASKFSLKKVGSSITKFSSFFVSDSNFLYHLLFNGEYVLTKNVGKKGISFDWTIILKDFVCKTFRRKHNQSISLKLGEKKNPEIVT